MQPPYQLQMQPPYQAHMPQMQPPYQVQTPPMQASTPPMDPMAQMMMMQMLANQQAQNAAMIAAASGSGCNFLDCANCGKPKFTHHDWSKWECPRTHYTRSGIMFGGSCRYCGLNKSDHVDPHYTCTGPPKYTGLVYGPCGHIDTAGLGLIMLFLYPFVAAVNLVCWLLYVLRRFFIDFFA